MAVLSDAERGALHAESYASVSAIRESTGSLTKADLRAAIDALDSFLDANATAINNAIPQPARSILTTGQKARLLAYIALKRWGG